MRHSSECPEDIEWFLLPVSSHREPVDRMNAHIHTEQRLTALNKVYGTPFGPDYLVALNGCIRANAQLGFVDAGLPLARKLIGLVDQGDDVDPGPASEATHSLLSMASACRRAGRFNDALELDSVARVWSGRPTAGSSERVAAVAAVAADHAALADPDRAVSVLRDELDDPASPLVQHRLSRSAIRSWPS